MLDTFVTRTITMILQKVRYLIMKDEALKHTLWRSHGTGHAPDARQTHGVKERNHGKEKEFQQITAVAYVKRYYKVTNKGTIKQSSVSWLKAALSLCYPTVRLDV
jgi:hypothetical protein